MFDCVLFAIIKWNQRIPTTLAASQQFLKETGGYTDCQLL